MRAKTHPLTIHFVHLNVQPASPPVEPQGSRRSVSALKIGPHVRVSVGSVPLFVGLPPLADDLLPRLADVGIPLRREQRPGYPSEGHDQDDQEYDACGQRMALPERKTHGFEPM